MKKQTKNLDSIGYFQGKPVSKMKRTELLKVITYLYENGMSLQKVEIGETIKSDKKAKLSWIDPEEVTGTNNDYVITRCAVYLLLLAMCTVLLVITN